MQSEQYKRPSNFIVKSVGPIVERLIDWIFLSSALLAPGAVIAAIYFLWNNTLALAALCLLIAIAAGLGIYARFVAPWQLRVKRLEIGDWRLQSPPSRRSTISNLQSQNSELKTKNSKLKVVFFSDLHLGQYKRQAWAQRVVDAVNAESPDVVLIGGDLVGKTKCCDIRELLAPLQHLRATHGAFAVLGNHDYGIPGPDHSEELARLLPRLNIRLLRNECVTICGRVRLVGVDEIWAKRDDLPGALAQCGDHSSSDRTLVLGHNPDLMLKIERHYPWLEAQTRDAFFIFGHTHQGQIYIPFAPGLAIPIKSEFYRGSYHTPRGTLYVSSGCGENTTPTRLNTWPEIVVFEI